MMNSRLFACIFLIGILLSLTAKAYKCTIKGEVIGRDSKTLLLAKPMDIGSFSFADSVAIPVKDHHFEYTFDVNVTQAYELIFEDEFDNRAYNDILFFPEEGVIRFKLFAQNDAAKDEVIGGELNKEFAAYKIAKEGPFIDLQKTISTERSALQAAHNYYSPARDSIIKFVNHTDHDKIDPSVWKKLGELTKTDAGYTPEGRIVNHLQDSLNAAKTKWDYDYFNSHVNILSYYLLYQRAKNAKDDKTAIITINTIFKKFAKAYPTHPYTKIVGNILNGYNKISPGEMLTDITLPDLNGKEHSLSGLSKGKLTLIDFWGSWCGPCIAASRTMLPVYTDFKDKGFTVIGVAKEYKNTKALKIALAREKYPWVNLVELDDKHQVWAKFGITSSTGMMMLVDSQGKIIAVDPTAETVRKEALARL